MKEQFIYEPRDDYFLIFTTSPTRNDYWDHFVNLRYPVLNDEYPRFQNNYKNRENSILALRSKIEELIDPSPSLISNILYEGGWTNPITEGLELYRSNRGNLLNKDFSHGLKESYLKYSKISIKNKNFTQYPHDLKKIISDLNKGKVNNLHKKLLDAQWNLPIGNNLYYSMLEIKSQLLANSISHSLTDSFIKNCKLWTTPEIIELPFNDIDWFHMKIEWLLAGNFYPGGKNFVERSIFNYFHQELGLNIEDYLDRILSSSMTEQEIRFLLLVVYTRSLPMFFPSWIGSKVMPLISNENLEYIKNLIINSTIWSSLLESNLFNKYENDALMELDLK